MADEKGIDLFELGRYEKTVVLTDPDDPAKTAAVRFVRMKPKEADECRESALKAMEDSKKKAFEDEFKTEEITKTLSAWSKESLIGYLLPFYRAKIEGSSDLIELPDESDMTKEKRAEELKKKLDAKEAEHRQNLEQREARELLDEVRKEMIEADAGGEFMRVFTEMSLVRMCYHPDKEERYFSDDPASPRHLSNLRDVRIYGQLMNAYKEFTEVLRASAKQIRRDAQRGGPFSTTTPSAKS